MKCSSCGYGGLSTFGSVCSGIEAASAAWHPLGWRAAWLAEIEAFPAAVLAHHYPDVPNLGDMTNLPKLVLTGKIAAPDVLVGGTPCQAFSVAGLREGLNDPRGQLTIKFVELADAIDHVRAARGDDPATVVWENVPGVLSDKGNAFGCFLGALSGEDCELQPPGGKWSNAGCVFGPKRAIAWRILDAQYFGVAQRRRRVFVVASARNGFNPAQVLFEFDGLRRDTPPRRGKGPAVAALTANSVGTCGADDNQGQAGHLIPEPCWWDGGQVSQTLDAVLAKGQTMPEKNRFPAVLQPIAHSSSGAGYWRDGIGPLRGREQDSHENLISFHPTQDPISSTDGSTHAMGCGSSGGQATVAVALPLLEVGKRTGASTTDVRAGLGIGAEGDPMFTLQAGAQHGVAVSYGIRTANTSSNGWGVQEELTHTLDQGMGVAVAVSLRGREGGATAELGDDIGNCLRASGGGGDKAHVLAPAIALQTDVTPKASVELAFTLKLPSSSGGGQPAAAMTPEMAVRRLTPRECERLQGFPDDYTLVEWYECCGDRFHVSLGKHGCPNCEGDKEGRLKTAADGPRYKALGNSMAVPCMAWIGSRIKMALN